MKENITIEVDKMNVMIVLNYNDFETTSKYLKRIQNYQSLDKIIVVDNCSPDGSYEKLLKYSNEKIDIIQTDVNGGYASGNNYGINYADRKYDIRNIIISNPDIVVSDSSIFKFEEFLSIEHEAVVVTGVIYNNQNEIDNNFAWKLPSFRRLVLGCFIFTSKFLEYISNGSNYSKNYIIGKDNVCVDVVPGCFFVIKKQFFKEINYFDSDTFLFYEENILSHKIKELNRKAYILTSEKIIHEESVSINKSIQSTKRKLELLYESSLVYMEKYLRVTKLQKSVYKLCYKFFIYEYLGINKTRKILNSKLK